MKMAKNTRRRGRLSHDGAMKSLYQKRIFKNCESYFWCNRKVSFPSMDFCREIEAKQKRLTLLIYHLCSYYPMEVLMSQVQKERGLCSIKMMIRVICLMNKTIISK